MKTVAVLDMRPALDISGIIPEHIEVDLLQDEGTPDEFFIAYNVADQVISVIRGVESAGGWVLDEDQELLESLFAELTQPQKNALFKYVLGKLDASDFQVHDFIDMMTQLCEIEWCWLNSEGEDDEVLQLRAENQELRREIEQLKKLVNQEP